MLESTVQAEIRKAVCGLGWARLVRNNTGKVADAEGQWHVFGLGKGGADLVGFVQVEPSGIARVFCLEVKRPKGGRIAPEQLAWLGAINKRGGAAAVCRSATSAVAFAIRARTGELIQGVPILP